MAILCGDSKVLGCLFLCLMALKPAATVRILSIPQNINSHYLSTSRLLVALTDDGHEATMFMASNAKVPDFLQKSNVQIVKYKANYDVPFMNTEESSRLLIRTSLTGSMVEKYKSIRELRASLIKHWGDDCLMMLESDVVKEHLKSNKYDVFLADNAGIDCQPVVAFQHGLPIIIFGVLSMPWTYRASALPSFVPMMLTQFSDEMTFLERLQNTLIAVLVRFAMIRDVSVFEKYVPESGISHVLQILQKSVFYLVLDDSAISYPLPMMPNMAYVGDIIPQPARELPKDIKDFVESSKDGVIIVSFGSFVDYLPDEMLQRLCLGFLRLKQNVIWKLKNKDACQAPKDKVLLMDWLPQNDLLGHPNVKLFVSHCGMNSVLESIYHGTPILGVPISIDQPYNAARVQSRGQGLHMSLNNFTEDELVGKVEEILDNKLIQDNVKKASAVMKDNMISPAKRASYWVNHVVKYGDKHLRTGAFKLNDLQFFMVDIFLALLVIPVVLLLLVLCTLRCCCRCLCRCRNRKVKSE